MNVCSIKFKIIYYRYLFICTFIYGALQVIAVLLLDQV